MFQFLSQWLQNDILSQRELRQGAVAAASGLVQSQKNAIGTCAGDRQHIVKS